MVFMEFHIIGLIKASPTKSALDESDRFVNATVAPAKIDCIQRSPCERGHGENSPHTWIGLT